MSDTPSTEKEKPSIQEQLAAQVPKAEQQIEQQIASGKLREPKDLPLATNNDKPYISFDFDGVICRPPFGMNQVLGRNLHEEELPESIRMVDGPATTLKRRVYLQARGL